MTGVHIYAPRSYTWPVYGLCPTCERRTLFARNLTPWLGSIDTCTHCGDAWCEEGRMERPFAPAWRKDSIARALRLLAHGYPTSRAAFDAMDDAEGRKP